VEHIKKEITLNGNGETEKQVGKYRVFFMKKQPELFNEQK